MDISFNRKNKDVINNINPMEGVKWNPCKVVTFNFGGVKRIHEFMFVEGLGSVCKVYDEEHKLVDSSIIYM